MNALLTGIKFACTDHDEKQVIELATALAEDPDYLRMERIVLAQRAVRKAINNLMDVVASNS